MSEQPVVQITDTKSLRKLNARLSESRFAQQKGILQALLEFDKNTTHVTSDMVADFKGILTMPRVKENQHMVAIFSEIVAYLEVANIDAAIKVADRVLNIPTVVQLGKPRGNTQ